MVMIWKRIHHMNIEVPKGMTQSSMPRWTGFRSARLTGLAPVVVATLVAKSKLSIPEISNTPSRKDVDPMIMSKDRRYQSAYLSLYLCHHRRRCSYVRLRRDTRAGIMVGSGALAVIGSVYTVRLVESSVQVSCPGSEDADIVICYRVSSGYCFE